MTGPSARRHIKKGRQAKRLSAAAYADAPFISRFPAQFLAVLCLLYSNAQKMAARMIRAPTTDVALRVSPKIR